MSESIIKKCFVCGLAFFATNLIFSVIKFGGLWLLPLYIFPGFVFGFILTEASKNGLNAKGIFFVLVSGIIYFICEWISMGSLFRFNDQLNLSMAIATTLGAVSLFVACKLMLHKSLCFLRGIIFSFITGIVSSILPIIGFSVEFINSSFWLSGACLFSVFITWQTLFGWTIQKADRQPLTLALQKSG